MYVASVMLAAALGLVSLSSASTRTGQDNGLKGVVVKIADLIKKGDDAGAKKLAVKAAGNKELVETAADVMHLFRTRNRGGIGIGVKPLANPAKDGIELAFRDIGGKDPGNLARHTEALEVTGYWIAAIAELSIAKGPDEIGGKKTKKFWTESSEEMRKLAIDFAKTAAGKNAQQIKNAASKLNENCNRCHSIFKNI
jgi:hypothetical protein